MKALIRVDAGPVIGSGHLMRMFALAQAIHDSGGEATFACEQLGESHERMLRHEGFEVRTQWSAFPDVVEDVRPQWTIFDGYEFGSDDFRVDTKVMVVDDYSHLREYPCDAIHNQTIDVGSEMYRDKTSAGLLLLGTAYALLRGDFTEYGGFKRTTSTSPSRLLVSLGGADHVNATAKVLDALAHLDRPGLDVKVLVGPYNPHREELKALAAAAKPSLELIESGDMKSLMAEADVGIFGSGSTIWEAAYMQLPSMAVVLAENQRAIGEGVDKAGFAKNLGWHDLLDPEEVALEIDALLESPETRAAMSAKGREYVDGKGAARVIGELEAYA